MSKTEVKAFIEHYERSIRNIMRVLNCDRAEAERAYSDIFKEENGNED